MTKEIKTSDDLTEFLNNYPQTTSTEIEGGFGLFKSDVSSLAREVRNGDAFVYTKDEWETELWGFVQEAANDKDLDNLEAFISDIKDLDDVYESFVINDVNGNTHYVF